MGREVFIATTGSGLARAWRDGDGGWSVERLLDDQDVRCLATDPLDPEVVYAGTQGSGLLRSTDRGRSWRPAGLQGMIVKSVAASPHQAGLLYAGLKSPRLAVSRDHGGRWGELDSFRRIPSRVIWFSPAEMPLKAYVQAIALSPADPSVILAGIEAGAVVRSGDGGRTWVDHRRGALRDCHSLIFHSTDGRWVYEGGGSGAGAALSRDGGVTWDQPRAGLDRHYGWAVASDPAEQDTWYVSASTGAFAAHGSGSARAAIFRSREGGSWQKLAGGLPDPLDHMPYALLTDGEAPGHIYAGLRNGEVWHSADHGDSWRRLPFSLGHIERSLVAM